MPEKDIAIKLNDVWQNTIYLTAVTRHNVRQKIAAVTRGLKAAMSD